jgi:cytochrome c oxidase subunit 1
MGSAAMFGMFAGIYHWYPRMFGKMMNEKLGYLHFWLTFAAVYCVFFPMHFMGLDGVPRRYYSFTGFEYMTEWVNMNKFITLSAILGSMAQLIFLYNFFGNILKGKRAPQNPWNSNTLEWTAPVEHLHGNWPGDIPHVHRWPYDYSRPEASTDFIPQNISDEGLEERLGGSKTIETPSHQEIPSAKSSADTMLFSRLLAFLSLKRS